MTIKQQVFLMKHIFGVILLVFAGTSEASCQADNYPSRTVTIMVSSAAGSAADAVARQVAFVLQKSFGNPVIVENRAGAQGLLAGAAVARAEPDGYTLMMATNSSISAAPYLYKNIPFDPLKDFRPLACIATGPLVLVVPVELPVATVQELSALAKKQPGTLTYGFQGTAPQTAAAMFVKMAEIDVLPVPFRSAAQAMTEVLAGRISMMFLDAKNAKPLVDGGKLRVLASASKTRSRMFPDIPTLDEAGYVDYNVLGWFGLFAPSNLSQSAQTKILAKLNSDYFGRADGEEHITSQGLDPCPTGRDPESFHVFLQEDTVRWKRLLEVSGIEKQ